MKTYKFIISMLAVASIASACNDELNPNEINKANPGDEVQFGLSLPGKTKTVYGEETATGFPIYWVNGDKVRVASPQCQSGRNNAEYKVEAGSNQNYATSLSKTGDAGLQWGESATADFYSIYPSNGNTSLEVSTDSEGKTTKAVAKLKVSAAQTARLSSTVTDGDGNPVLQPDDMSDVVMYAKTTSVKSGKTVELQYVPFSTVIEFEINGPVSGEGDMTVQSITLSAPEGTNIAGTFELDLLNASAVGNTALSAKNIGKGSNTILLHLLDKNNAYITVGAKKKVKAKLCLLPQPYTSLEGWTVTVACNAGQYSKTIGQYNVEEGKTKNLVAGQVHKVQLPPLSYKEGWTYEQGNWITSLPDYGNIYLSELSLPGAWYAGSTEAYQATPDIATLWNAGVRAFAVETKTITGGRYEAVPTGVVLSGTGSNSASYLTYSSGTNSLHTSAGKDGRVYYDGTRISTVISNIANQVKKDEYAVLVLSYADGGVSGLRYVDYGAWLQLLYDAYNGLDANVKGKIYQYQITANTTVNDVLGKLILKINVDSNIAMSGTVSSTTFTYNNNLPALFSYNPFLSQMSNADYTKPYYSNLSWKNWGDATTPYRSYDLVSSLQGASGNEDKLVWVFSSANRTQNDKGSLSYPTYTQRQTALKAMMDYSKQIYDASTHNVWFYFNCGGTLVTTNFWGDEKDPSPTEFAKTMNLWLKNTINAKTDPSPLGIVMFNQCTGANATYYGEDIIKAIIEMNSKFYLKHAGTSGGSTGGSTSGNEAPNDATLDNGGKAI